MKEKRYNKIKKSLMAGASSSIVAGMMFVGGANTVYAAKADNLIPAYSQNASSTGMHIMHKWNSSTKVNALATSLGLDVSMVNQELKSGKNLKQILQDHGIVPSQIQQAFAHKKNAKGWRKNI